MESNEEKVISVVRAETLAQRAGAYYVRIQAMAKKHHISLEQEFDEHDTPETNYILMLDHDFPVATCRLYAIDQVSVMIGRVVVLPEYRHMGLGSQVILAAEQWARELGFQKSVLESREGKTGFYERLGYTADYHWIIKGDTFTCVHMEKELQVREGHA